MKRTGILAVLMIVLAAGLVAAQPWGAQDGPGVEEAPESQTLEGRLRLEDGERPVLVADGEEYILRINRLMADELSVRDGQSVTVEGYVVTLPGRDLLGDELVVMVQAFEADDTRVVIPHGVGGPHAGGWARGTTPGAAVGRMGGRGAFGGDFGRGGRR